MALHLSAPKHSFVQFESSDAIESCEFADIELCLPVYEEDDVAFQFIITADTQAEADALCDLSNSLIGVGIVDGCDGDFLLQFAAKPERFRISSTKVLYNWGHGVPGFSTVVSRGDCFRIKIITNGEGDFSDDFSDDFGGEPSYSFCSNCFQRISTPCHTSVVEYGNDDNFADFNYCNSTPDGEVVTPGEGSCESTVITFNNVPSLAIPYTTALLDKHGPAPNVKVWIFDADSILVDMGVRVTFDSYPPSIIRVDLGGNASGILVLK